MDTNTLYIIGGAALVIVALLLMLVMTRRGNQTKGLKKQFGPEYEHAVKEYGGPKKAEAELQARQKRVGAFDLRPLAPEEHDRFAEQWRATQGEFVDTPDKAVLDADHLVKQVMLQRGYPVADFEQRAADISVDRPTFVTNYRMAHEIALKQEKGKASTEELRQAMVHFRALFDDLLKTDTTTDKAYKDNGKVKAEVVKEKSS